MKQIAMLVVCLSMPIFLNGCLYTMRADTKVPNMAQCKFQDLNIKQPVTINNISQNNSDIELGKVLLGWKVKGNLYELTETSVEITKKVLADQKVTIAPNSTKALSLSVDEVKATKGGARFLYLVELKAKTGSGLIKIYNSEHDCYNLTRTSAAIEYALAKCVEKMLNDPEIVNYFEK